MQNENQFAIESKYVNFHSEVNLYINWKWLKNTGVRDVLANSLTVKCKLV
jgi:hypothetical protein